MRLLLDEMLDPEIAVQLRSRGHDVTAVREDRRLRGRADAEIVQWAREQRRAVVTSDVRDFSRLHRRFLEQDHEGMILAAPRSFPRAKSTIGLWVRTLAQLLAEGRADCRGICVWLERPADA